MRNVIALTCLWLTIAVLAFWATRNQTPQQVVVSREVWQTVTFERDGQEFKIASSSQVAQIESLLGDFTSGWRRSWIPVTGVISIQCRTKSNKVLWYTVSADFKDESWLGRHQPGPELKMEGMEYRTITDAQRQQLLLLLERPPKPVPLNRVEDKYKI